MDKSQRKELNTRAKKVGGKSARWIGLTGSFTGTGSKSQALKRAKENHEKWHER